MNLVPESKKNHLWRKVVWHTDPEKYPLGPHHFAEVYCCEESNGFAIWYVRKLARDDTRGIKGVENADYLLAFYAKTQRDAALERAVLLANSSASADAIIESLDKVASSSQKV